MKKTKLKVGDRVRISKDSEYYKEGSESNPKDVTGTVSKVCKDESFCYRVDWDNGTDNNYQINDLYLYSEKNNNSNELTVSKEFVLEAHKAACSDWKKKLEKQFPEVFESNKYPTLVDLEPGEALVSATLYVEVVGPDGKERHVALNGVQIADGIANDYDLPTQAKHKALYISQEVLNYGEYEVKQKCLSTRSYAVYFEKK